MGSGAGVEMRPACQHVTTIPTDRPLPTDAGDFNPMWVGSVVYFLSDRDGATALYAYDLGTKGVRRLTDPNGADIKSAAACSDAIVYDKPDGIYLYDIVGEAAKKLAITVRGDLPGVRPRAEKVARQVQNADLSPTGARAVFEARGEILTVPAEKRSARNLTNTPGAADRDPAWSLGSHHREGKHEQHERETPEPRPTIGTFTARRGEGCSRWISTPAFGNCTGTA